MVTRFGAKIVNKFYEDGICNKQEAERMLAFTNNSGPLFIIGTVGISLFGNTTIGIILFITHILACLTVGLLFGFISKKNNNSHHIKTKFNSVILNNRTNISNKNSKKYNFLDKYRKSPIVKAFSETRNASTTYKMSDLGTIISTSINNAISTILLIGGFIVLFSIIISIVNNLNLINYLTNFFNILHIPTNYIKHIFIGLLELTNGVNSVCNMHIKHMSTQIIITAFLLGFAGISIFLQIFSIAAKNNLSMKPYFIGKVLQGFFAAFYTFIIINNFNFLQFNIINL